MELLQCENDLADIADRVCKRRCQTCTSAPYVGIRLMVIIAKLGGQQAVDGCHKTDDAIVGGVYVVVSVCIGDEEVIQGVSVFVPDPEFSAAEYRAHEGEVTRGRDAFQGNGEATEM